MSEPVYICAFSEHFYRGVRYDRVNEDDNVLERCAEWAGYGESRGPHAQEIEVRAIDKELGQMRGVVLWTWKSDEPKK